MVTTIIKVVICVVDDLNKAWVDSIKMIKNVFQHLMISCDDVSINKTWAFLANVIVRLNVKISSLFLETLFNFVSDNKCQIAEG